METIAQEIDRLQTLVLSLKAHKELNEKKKILLAEPFIEKTGPSFFFLLDHLPIFLFEEAEYLLLSLVAIKQAEIVFFDVKSHLSKVEKIFLQLIEVEKFYEPLGGIVGYQLSVLRLIAQKGKKIRDEEKKIYQPHGFDISHLDEYVKESIVEGLKRLPDMAEIYPIGGLGDRMNLLSENGEPLPAACLQFLGHSLLEGLIRDLQAREYLYYKLFGNSSITPVAMMTSHEKNNHALITTICEKNEWFGRPKDSFNFFSQISVPVVTKNGDWSLLAPCELNLKPGGHGVLWKIAKDRGVFDWFKEKGRDYLLVRQINNPIAGIDYGLTAFYGIGLKEKKSFGLASCQRLVHAAEGVLVLAEKSSSKFEYTLSNIEYTDFESYGIEDIPGTSCLKSGDQYSLYPANTNILFGDLSEISACIEKQPFPGMMINMKTKAPCFTSQGYRGEIESGRLETMMQNISDEIIDRTDERQAPHYSHQKCYLTYNQRQKTISTTKKSYEKGKSLLETPEGCFYDYLSNGCDLLKNYCNCIVPQLPHPNEYVEKGPSFLFFYHQALGPFYSIIGQKICSGTIEDGSELQLEIAELELKNFSLQGSCLIKAENVLGSSSTHYYSENSGKCRLRNVAIINQGVDKVASSSYWKNQIVRKEALIIELEGNAEFEAEDVVFHGSFHFKVPAGKKWIARQKAQFGIEIEEVKIDLPSWFWEITLSEKKDINLKRKTLF